MCLQHTVIMSQKYLLFHFERCLFLSFTTLIMEQVCLEEMSPPTRIFQCRNGHLLCETCKSVSKVGIYISDCTHLSLNLCLSNFTNLQERLEPVHLSQVQAGDDRKGNRHGELPQVGLNLLLFTFCLANLLCGQEHAVVSSFFIRAIQLENIILL